MEYYAKSKQRDLDREERNKLIANEAEDIIMNLEVNLQKQIKAIAGRNAIAHLKMQRKTKQRH